uniref:Uncharacterized protein n=1 Tax=Populus trichocarpa TaxID=3694 RepID=A0A2K1Y3K5_POPTR
MDLISYQPLIFFFLVNCHQSTVSSDCKTSCDLPSCLHVHQSSQHEGKNIARIFIMLGQVLVFAHGFGLG